MALPKPKMRTSEDLYHRLKWDEEFANDEVTIGYEDRIEGPMEMSLAAFLPISEDGNIPFHRIWYFRRGDEVLWDRRRRLDRVFQSGETSACLAVKPPKSFDKVADTKAAKETAVAIKEAQATLIRMEEERQILLERKQHAKARKAAAKARPANAAIAEFCEQVTVDKIGEGSVGATMGQKLRVATWNVLFDDHITDPGLISTVRAPRIVEALLAVQPDILALQEITDAVMHELLLRWPQPCWCARLSQDLAVVSRYPITRSCSVKLGPHKKALLCEVTLPGRVLAIANVHLTSDRRGDESVDNSDKRRDQAKKIRAALLHFAGRGADTIVCGDFNEPSASGAEAAASCMDGLTDAWVAVHGHRDPGCTFDPQQNRLADLGSINKQPRRVDRIFGASCWKAEAASLFGDHAAKKRMSFNLWLEQLELSEYADSMKDFETVADFIDFICENGGFASETLRAEMKNRWKIPPGKVSKMINQAELCTREADASDHFGLLVDFSQQSPLLSAPVHTSAIVILPPENLWPRIDDVRKKFDPSFGRWMPHINLIYGFLPQQQFDFAALAAEKVMRRHGPFEIVFDELTIFEHGRSASLVIVPSSGCLEAVCQLQADLEALFPACIEQSRHGNFCPHLTLGSFDCVDDARRCKADLEVHWEPMAFVVEEVGFVARNDDKPFAVATRLPLGTSLSEWDATLLQMLESRTGARAFPIGSAAMLGGARPSDSDFDILLVGKDSREVVFQALEEMDVSWSRRADAKFPVLQMQIGDTLLDIQYARSGSSLHPLFWSSIVCDEGGHAAAAVHDAYRIRSAILEAHGLTCWHQYQQALLLIKKWAKTRGINCNSLGYLGGISWALLLASATLTQVAPGIGNSQDGLALAVSMWQKFARWEWPRPVFLARDAPSKSAELMPILCPTESDANSARNVTAATLQVLRSEFRLAASGVQVVPILNELLDVYPVFVCCEVKAQRKDWLQCVHWFESRLMMLIRGLDSLCVRPLKVVPGLWLVGVAMVQNSEQNAGYGPMLVRSRSEMEVENGGRAALTDAVEDFRRFVDRGEWKGLIEINIEDSAAARQRIQMFEKR